MYSSTFKDVNIYKTAAYCTEMMVYLEKHRLLEICSKILIEVSIERPANVAHWLSTNIKRVAREIQLTRTFIYLPNNISKDEFSKLLLKNYNIPTVVYNKRKCSEDTNHILKKLEAFLETNRLDKKHRIYLNFPKYKEEVMMFRHMNQHPTSIIKTKCAKRTCSQNDPLNVFRNYYSKILHEIKFNCDGCESVCSSSGSSSSSLLDANKDFCIDYLLGKIMQCIRHQEQPETKYLIGAFCFRIVIYGRRGSGKHTQAVLLSKRFNIVLVNVEALIFSYMTSPCSLGEALRDSLKRNNEFSQPVVGAIVFKRIFQPDCLSNGWVIFNYPTDIQGFQIIIEKFKTPPNKIICLHCRESVANRRMIKRFEKICNNDGIEPRPKDTVNYLKQEMKYFKFHNPGILKYLAMFKETIHINGCHSSNTVRADIWSRINQRQHGIGLMH